MFKASLLIVLWVFAFYFLFQTPGVAQPPQKSVTGRVERPGGTASGQTATQYRVPYSVISSGGREMANSSFRVMGTLGQQAMGEIGNPSHRNTIGFWYEDANLRGIMGDVSGEGLANSTDALILLSYDVSMPIPPEILNRIYIGFGDTNSDDFTNSTDALIILSYDVGMAVPFPVGQLVIPLPGSVLSSYRATGIRLKEGEKIVAAAVPKNPRIIHNVLGQKVRTLVDEKQPAGSYELKWQGRNDQLQVVASGMYYLRMQAGNPSAGPGQGFLAERKLLFLK
jgi:hypothetical protein